MNTLWSCVTTLIILCFIGILIWLLLRKRISHNKKLKGASIKIKGGLTTEEAASILEAQFSPDVENKPDLNTLIRAALVIIIENNNQNFIPENSDMQNILNMANLTFSTLLTAIINGHGVNNEEDVMPTVESLIIPAMQTENLQIIGPVLFAVMKSPRAPDITNAINENEGIRAFYTERVDYDYLARTFFMCIGDDNVIKDMIIRDIKNKGDAIKHAVALGNTNVIGIVIRDFNEFTETVIEEDKIAIKTLVSCLIYINQYTEFPDAAEAAAEAALSIYYTNVSDDPVTAWLCADEVCVLDGFRIREDMINPELFIKLAIDFPGEVDFEHIVSNDGVDDAKRNEIFLAQGHAFCAVPELEEIGDVALKMKVAYEIASKIVMPATEL